MITSQSSKPTVTTDEWKRNLRRSARVKAHFPVTVTCTVDGVQVTIQGYARNISAQGIGALIPARLEIDQTLELQFALPHSDLQFTLKAIVRACDEGFYGIEFLDTDAAARRVLRAFALL